MSKVSIGQKMLQSGLSALLFIAVSHEKMYRCFGNAEVQKYFHNATGCVTSQGAVSKGVVFYILMFVSMMVINMLRPTNMRKSIRKMVGYSLISTVVFYFASSNLAYDMLHKFIGTKMNIIVKNALGCPTPEGIKMAAILFAIVSFSISIFIK